MQCLLCASSNEHDPMYVAINVINSRYQVYNWGVNNGMNLGRGVSGNVDPVRPDGINSGDKITVVETGGHTTMFTKMCTQNYGYLGIASVAAWERRSYECE